MIYYNVYSCYVYYDVLEGKSRRHDVLYRNVVRDTATLRYIRRVGTHKPIYLQRRGELNQE